MYSSFAQRNEFKFNFKYGDIDTIHSTMVRAFICSRARIDSAHFVQNIESFTRPIAVVSNDTNKWIYCNAIDCMRVNEWLWGVLDNLHSYILIIDKCQAAAFMGSNLTVSRCKRKKVTLHCFNVKIATEQRLNSISAFLSLSLPFLSLALCLSLSVHVCIEHSERY